MTIKEILNFCHAQIKEGNHPDVMRAIIKAFTDKKPKAPPNYQQSVQLYKAFLTQHKLPFLMDARNGKALKDLLQKLKNISTEKTDESALLSLQAILSNWQKVGEHLGKQKSISDINRNLLEIIDKIKNGATKKQTHTDRASDRAELGNLARQVLLSKQNQNGGG
ncbi:hypothetical protein [Pedobacter arcticus]|uniref:hypothetical protein n=1 Tax=Pedobacter arcticus TaxID=752140 RepID=UPI0002EA222E|nr:hypothetical protein [Pedobacter arcticus]